MIPLRDEVRVKSTIKWVGDAGFLRAFSMSHFPFDLPFLFFCFLFIVSVNSIQKLQQLTGYCTGSPCQRLRPAPAPARFAVSLGDYIAIHIGASSIVSTSLGRIYCPYRGRRGPDPNNDIQFFLLFKRVQDAAGNMANNCKQEWHW